MIINTEKIDSVLPESLRPKFYDILESYAQINMLDETRVELCKVLWKDAHLFAAFRSLAIDILRINKRRCSARGILHILRMLTPLNDGHYSRYGINNNLSRPLAELLVKLEPATFQSVFEFRVPASKQYKLKGNR